MSDLKNWMKIVEQGSDSFDSDHSAENLVNYYDTDNDKPEKGDSMDFEFGDKLAIEGTIDSYSDNECVINIDPQAMAMLEDLNVIDTTEGFEVLPKMDRDKYQERDGLEGPIMTRSGKVVYYDNDKGDYYDPDTDMYIDYEDFKALDRKAITAEAEEHTYTVVHAKHGKEEIKASSSYGAAKKYAEMKKLKGTSGVDAHLHTKEDFDKDHPDFPKAQAFKGEKQQVMDIMKKYPEEAKKLKDGSFDFYGSDLYNELMDYYADEMPYGVMKARDGDPMEWLDSKLDDLGLLDEGVYEAKYQGKTVKLNKPIRTGTDEPKKFKVYVKDGDKVKMVRFGHQGGGKNKDSKTMKIKKSDPKRRKSFRARHNCDNPGPKTKARYWSCRMW